MRSRLTCVVLAFTVLAACSGRAAPDRPLVVASKNFNESYILGEIMAQLLESRGFEVERRFGLGGTLICFEALVSGEIDVYAEYTGTLSQAILKQSLSPDVDSLRRLTESLGVTLLEPFGFNNTYAIAIPRAIAEAKSISTVSDLSMHRELRVVVSHEFLERADGWPGLQRAYGFDWIPLGIEHGLAYQALADGEIDVTDAYSTDGEIERYNLKVLQDDREFFPIYLAVPLVRIDMPESAKVILREVANTLDDDAMSALNSAVLFRGESFASAASIYLRDKGFVENAVPDRGIWPDLRRNTLRHLKLTGIALGLATVFGVLLALAVFRIGWLSRGVVYIAGLLQTIPSIALLALMIPLFGIGEIPAIIALFLYSLLPILRNTVTALTTVDPVLRRIALAIGLTRRQEVRHVYVPLAMPSMLAGIRTAAVISIGTATLAAFIGAGGLGDPIVTGLALNDRGLILQGAIPAAALAIVTELVFEGIEKVLVPKHLA
ncbi:MAG: ABC transporter permease subunit [Gammaproteobacteria bacterium]|nr:ABC transporter permease subunit [Gammaproteobacteria bacterium]